MPEFDPKHIAEEIAKHKPALLQRIETAVAAKLNSMTPRRALSLRLMSGENTRRVITTAASFDYVEALVAFMRQADYYGYQVDSAVTPVILAVIEAEVVAFYSSQPVTEAIIAGILQEIQSTVATESVVRAHVQENLDWLRKEYTTVVVESSNSISGMLIDAAAGQIQAFLSSAAGKAVTGAIAKTMATAAGKLALQRMLMVIVKKVMASAAIKTSILAIIKKVGVGIIIKTVVGKALLAMLAAAGLANIPLAWILLPLIAGFLVYEYATFPEKLAKKLPAEIRYAMSIRFGDLNEKIATAAARAIFTVLETEITKPRAA